MADDDLISLDDIRRKKSTSSEDWTFEEMIETFKKEHGDADQAMCFAIYNNGKDIRWSALNMTRSQHYLLHAAMQHLMMEEFLFLNDEEDDGD